MLRLLLPFTLLAVALACSQSDTRYDGSMLHGEDVTDGDDAPPAGADASAASYRFDVFPLPTGVDADALLPQSFEGLPENGPLDFVLQRPIQFEGSVSGYSVGPLARSTGLPGATLPVDGTVTVRRPSSVQRRTTTTDDGDFALTVVPGANYRLAVVPSDPSLPVYTAAIELTEDRLLDLDIGSGGMMWGHVLDGAGSPVAGVGVRAVSAFGVHTPTTTTASDGSYVLRVSPGSWRVEALGRQNGRDPSLDGPLVLVEEYGTRVDVVYASFVSYVVSGRMSATAGSSVRDGRARFTAIALTGYDDNASLSVEVRADSFGNFDARLLGGRYHVEVYPADDQVLTPVDFGEIEVDGPLDLGTVTLPVGGTGSGVVLDPDGIPVPGALVDCEEATFARRVYSTHTDDAGMFSFSIPRVPLHCDIVPPGERTDVALTRRVVSFAVGEPTPLVLEAGVLFEGQVRYDADGALRPLELAVVEVRDAKSQLVGTTLTRVGDGSFAVRISTPAE